MYVNEGNIGNFPSFEGDLEINIPFRPMEMGWSWYYQEISFNIRPAVWLITEENQHVLWSQVIKRETLMMQIHWHVMTWAC